jgi:hypothetical protein
MSLAFTMAVTASCAVLVSITWNRGSQKDIVDPSAHEKTGESQMPDLIENASLHPGAQVSSRTDVEISLWSSAP